ncbi:MAG TPA: SDR family oxidoreductase [Acidimicrobiales bacterium]|jgi:NAD(P)-dependent dehydrogenase (short-subunit alcohol dehydrogenase family)|nr:SDR family oxidoreductase [Acidimicrobiales bacterium]
MDNLKGKRALVTGASSGIGQAIAVKLGAEGVAVGVGGRDVERVDQTCGLINAAGGRAVPVVGDVSDAQQAERVVTGTVDALGGLDIVVNNAGVDANEWRDVADWSIESFDEIMAINTRGPFLVSKFSIPHLLAAGGGTMLHISSVCAVTVWAGDCGYDISKAALNMLSDHIAVVYASRGIVSNTLMPGVVRTALHEGVMEGMNDGRAFERVLLSRHPIGRFGTVEEIAESAAFLCSGVAPFLTGANILIDGAYSRV